MAKRAFIVGINAYDPPNELPSCVADADAFAELLATRYGFTDITNLRDREASNAAIANGITALLANGSASDQLVFYYSGHGYSFEKNGALVEALVPQDANFLDSDQLAALTAIVPPGAFTVILDACFSGGMEKAFIRSDGLVERGRIKRFQPIASGKGFVLPVTTGKPLAYRPFGATSTETALTNAQHFSAGTQRSKAFVVVAQAPNGVSRRFLLMSACLSDETAAASTSQTEGKSAFTFSLLDRLASPALVGSPTAALMEAAGQRLRQLGITQTPMLKAPPGLDQRPFMHWQTDSASSSVSSSKTFSSTPTERTIPMYNSPVSAGEKAWYDFASQLASAVAPIALNQLRAATSKGFVTGADAITVDSKSFISSLTNVLSAALPVVAQAVPAVVQAISSQKGFQPAPVMAPEDKAWYDTLAHAVGTVVSSPIAQSALQVAIQAAAAG